MNLDWLNRLAQAINLTPQQPKKYVAQIAANLDPNNPMRPRLEAMTGTPTWQALQMAMNWEEAKRNYELAQAQLDLARERFNAETIDVTPEMFAEYDPNNLNARVLAANPGRRSLNVVAAINATEEALRRQAQQRAANEELLRTLQPYEAQLKSTPQGALLWNILTNPGVVPDEQYINYYGRAGDVIQGGINRAAQSKAAENIVSQMPEGPVRNIVQQLAPLVSQPGGENLLPTIYQAAINSIPQPQQPLSPLDEARIKHLNAQTWRIYNPLQDNNENTEFNFWSRFGFRNQNEATKFASDLERAYDLEAKRNGGKYVEDFNGEGRWVFPKGKATPSLNNWISKTYGPETLRRYLAVKTGNPEYLDMTRSLTGLQTPGLIQDEWDLAADQLVTQFGSYQMALKYAKDNNYDQRLIAALERRARILQSRKKK